MNGFVPPPYPYERLDGLLAKAGVFPGGAVDLSIGTPVDPPPDAVVRALSSSGSERGYPSSPGSAELRRAIVDWIGRRFDVAVGPDEVAACVGTKEFVGTLPQWLRLRRPDRDTVLYPGRRLSDVRDGGDPGGLPARSPCRSRPTVGSTSAPIAEADAARALALWVNSPGNPTGACDDLGQVAAWGRARDVPVFSDECYVRVHVGRAGPHRSCSTAPTASSPCTRSRSGPTWPVSASASTQAMPSSSTTCSRCASTSG